MTLTEPRHDLDDRGAATEALIKEARRHQRRRWAISAIAVVVAGSGVALVVNNGGGSSSDGHSARTGSPGPSAPLFSPHGQRAGVLFLAPTVVPDGFHLVGVTGGDRPGFSQGAAGSYTWDRTQQWVRLDRRGEHAVQQFTVSWGKGASAPLPRPARLERASSDPLEGFRAHARAVTVRGHRGLYLRHRGSLAWEEPKGQAVVIDGGSTVKSDHSNGSRPLALEQLRDIADGLRRSNGSFEVRRPPAGYRVAAEWPGYGSMGTNARTITYQSPYGRGFQVHIVDHSEHPPGANLYFSDARVVSVHGRDALLSPFLFAPPGGFNAQTLWLSGTDLFLQWIEPGNVLVTLRGVGLSESEIMTIARKLQIVDDQGWQDLQRQVVSTSPGFPPPTGPPPTDEDAARQAVTDTFARANDADTPLADRISLVDDSTGLRKAYRAARRYQREALDTYGVEVREVRFVNATEAAVLYDLVYRSPPTASATMTMAGRIGKVVFIHGKWKVSRESVCGLLGLAGAGGCRSG